MFDLTIPALHCSFPSALAAPPSRTAEPGRPHALARLLDLVDYGMLLVLDDACVVFANRAARAEMDDDHPLQLLGRELRARCPRDVIKLHAALSGATQRGVQSLLKLGSAGEHAIHVAVVPVAQGAEHAAAVMLGRPRVCEDLTIDGYARQYGLTLAEARVLRHLCTGDRPQDIACSLGVKLSTVRTQIGSIRGKTGARDIGAIVQRVARLPPLPCVARRAAAPN